MYNRTLNRILGLGRWKEFIRGLQFQVIGSVLQGLLPDLKQIFCDSTRYFVNDLLFGTAASNVLPNLLYLCPYEHLAGAIRNAEVAMIV